MDLVTAIRDNGGAMITGPGGVGKTVLVNNLIAAIKADCVARGIQPKIHVCALRHAAKALLDNGKTLAHLLYKLKDARDFWFIGDESSEIPLAMLADVARWSLVGVKFVIIGDFAGQLMPIFDRWGDAMQKHDIQNSDFMHGLCNGLQVHLTTCRRCPDDLPHFNLVQSLYSKPFYKPGEAIDTELFDEELRTTLATFRPQFCMPENAVADITLTISHYMRMAVNTVVNEVQQERFVEKLWMPWDQEPLIGFTMQPQSCWIWKGLEMVGCIRKAVSTGDLKNVKPGYSYTVMGFDAETVHLKVFPEYAKRDDAAEEAAGAEADDEGSGEDEPAVDKAVFKLGHALFMKHFRLPFAVPVCYSQGRTYRDKTVLLMDTESQHYTMRHLIVAASRVTKGKNLWIAPPDFGDRVLAMARDVEAARSRGEAWRRRTPQTTDAVPLCTTAYRRSRCEEEDARDARMMEEDSD